MPMVAELPQPEEINMQALAQSLKDEEIEMICVLGPTASGKTRYAVSLARQLNAMIEDSSSYDNAPSGKGAAASSSYDNAPSGKGAAASSSAARCEIISADSRQVYKGMDIGTGKDLCEYGEIPYHLIDIVPAGAKYNVYQYQQDFARVYQDIRGRGCVPILCGGTGLYIEAAACGYDFHKETPTVDPALLPTKTFFIGTLVDRDTRNARIDARLKARLEEGMVDEIRNLLDSGISAEDLIFYGLEYKFVTQHVLGELSADEMYTLLSNAIHQFAKRQMTWFRGMERDGITIHWTEVR